MCVTSLVEVEEVDIETGFLKEPFLDPVKDARLPRGSVALDAQCASGGGNECICASPDNCPVGGCCNVKLSVSTMSREPSEDMTSRPPSEGTIALKDIPELESSATPPHYHLNVMEAMCALFTGIALFAVITIFV